MPGTIQSDGRNESPFQRRLQAIRCIDGISVLPILNLFGSERQFGGKREIASEAIARNRIMVLIDGWACRYRLLPDGRRQIIMLLLPGDVCNPDVLACSNTSYTVMSLTPCTVIEADAAELRSLMLSSSKIAQAWMNLIFADTAMLAERNACLGRRSAREHLAHFLCELFIRLRRVGWANSDNFVMRATQEEIADTLGLTAVHVNRVLMVLRAEGLVSVHGHCVTILDWARLRVRAGFESRYLHIDGAGSAARDHANAFKAGEALLSHSQPCLN